MKAELVKMHCRHNGQNEYFAIKITDIDFNCAPNEQSVILQLPMHHYDILSDPEAVLSIITKAINR